MADLLRLFKELARASLDPMSAGARRPVLAALAATACAAGLAAPAGQASSPSSCVPRGGRVLAHDRRVRVYETPQRLFAACLQGRRSRVTLFQQRSPCCLAGRGPERIALAGTFLAYLLTTSGVDSGQTTLTVLDVASHRTLRRIEVGHYVDAGLLGAERATDLVLAANGAVAWIAARHGHGPAPSGPEDIAVHAAGPTGPPIVLDESPAIGESSLALSGTTLSWSHGGATRTARMP